MASLPPSPPPVPHHGLLVHTISMTPTRPCPDAYDTNYQVAPHFAPTPGLTPVPRDHFDGRSEFVDRGAVDTVRGELRALYTTHHLLPCSHHGLYWAGDESWTRIPDRDRTMLLVMELRQEDVERWRQIDTEAREILARSGLGGWPHGVCLRYYTRPRAPRTSRLRQVRNASPPDFGVGQVENVHLDNLLDVPLPRTHSPVSFLDSGAQDETYDDLPDLIPVSGADRAMQDVQTLIRARSYGPYPNNTPSSPHTSHPGRDPYFSLPRDSPQFSPINLPPPYHTHDAPTAAFVQNTLAVNEQIRRGAISTPSTGARVPRSSEVERASSPLDLLPWQLRAIGLPALDDFWPTRTQDLAAMDELWPIHTSETASPIDARTAAVWEQRLREANEGIRRLGMNRAPPCSWQYR